ncbi:AvrE-family type 3 secretion system effector [Enterobacter hormaechei]|uniref:AvrE-family type 3 secretion system effector n=1 Tax=Enterobacter hormaechei TaxID=158836 RepID=A0A927DJK9_9ENTR|nr:AvrE-family type 3 secretion system effector [Enterobacter hormaechei]
MVGTLHQMIANHPSAHTTAAQNVVTGMQKSRLTIDHLKPNVEKPVRDSGDELGLVKSRLFLDAMTQQGLHSAIDIYERSPAFGDSRGDRARRAAKEYPQAARRDWGGNTVKKLTDRGLRQSSAGGGEL